MESQIRKIIFSTNTYISLFSRQKVYDKTHRFHETASSELTLCVKYSVTSSRFYRKKVLKTNIQTQNQHSQNILKTNIDQHSQNQLHSNLAALLS